MKLTKIQQIALNVVQELIKEEKITLQQAFDLITAIYEREKEYVYIPSIYPEPYKPWTVEPSTTPQPIPVWYGSNEITCNGSQKIFTYNSTF